LRPLASSHAQALEGVVVRQHLETNQFARQVRVSRVWGASCLSGSTAGTTNLRARCACHVYGAHPVFLV